MHVQVCVATLKYQITLATASMRVLEQVDTLTLRMEDVTRTKLAKVYQVRDCTVRKLDLGRISYTNNSPEPQLRKHHYRTKQVRVMPHKV
jgi:hypothetical protein